MWECPTRKAIVEDDHWEECWKCANPRDLSEADRATLKERILASTLCLRCNGSMEYSGTKRFHEGRRMGALGDLAELFVGREAYNVYFCTQCGKAEFYIDGIGEANRAKTEPQN